MLHIVKTTKLINKRMAVLCGLLFAAVLVMVPIPIGAQCGTAWNATGEVVVRQRGQRKPIVLNLVQKGKVVTGTADLIAYMGLNNGERRVTGTVDRTLDGDSLSFQIFWHDNSTGVYSAKVLPTGRLDGETYDKNNSRMRQPWNSDGVIQCPPPPPVIPKVLISTGKKPAPKPEPPKPPFIIAGRPIITPYNPIASVYLGWEGGPDHPKVEIWLSIDNGVEIPAFSTDFVQGHPVFKQPKASLELRLQKGRHYRFVLKDGDKTLSSVSFIIPLF